MGHQGGICGPPGTFGGVVVARRMVFGGYLGGFRIFYDGNSRCRGSLRVFRGSLNVLKCAKILPAGPKARPGGSKITPGGHGLSWFILV